MDQIRTLKKFGDDGAACPVCNTRNKGEVVIIPIDGAKGGTQQFHLDCVKHLIGQMHYNDEKYIVYAIV